MGLIMTIFVINAITGLVGIGTSTESHKDTGGNYSGGGKCSNLGPDYARTTGLTTTTRHLDLQ